MNNKITRKFSFLEQNYEVFHYENDVGDRIKDFYISEKFVDLSLEVVKQNRQREEELESKLEIIKEGIRTKYEYMKKEIKRASEQSPNLDSIIPANTMDENISKNKHESERLNEILNNLTTEKQVALNNFLKILIDENKRK